MIDRENSVRWLAWTAGVLVMAITACAPAASDSVASVVEKPVLARVVAQDGPRWLLQVCGEDFDCEPPTGMEFLVEVRHPYAADLRVRRRVFVCGEPGGTIGGRPLLLVTDEQGIDPKDEDGGR